MRARSCDRGASAGVGALAALALFGAVGCGSASLHAAAVKPGTIAVVAAENEYGNVAAQVGGRYVTVTSIETNPNTDPHTYEVSPSVAQSVSAARLVIQNGVGYDDFMTKIESASGNSARQVIDVQHLLGLADSTSNPHLWYSPTTMPKVADTVASDLANVQPAHRAYFDANAAKFIGSLNPWLHAIAQFKARDPDTAVATTEPVADDMLVAAGTNNLTPFQFQADIMNGVDPSPQDVAFQTRLFSQHEVKVFVYNQQVTDALTQTFIAAAAKAHIPVVGVYETMPTPGYDYQSWMLAEIDALRNAVDDGVSTARL
jgi:zinc/manganese transport system substrate-binding protein